MFGKEAQKDMIYQFTEILKQVNVIGNRFFWLGAIAQEFLRKWSCTIHAKISFQVHKIQ